MKRLFITLVTTFILIIYAIAQIPQINGFWQCSTTGNVFQVEGINGGFRYKLSTNSGIYTARFIGNNFGTATFRSDFNDGSFSLFMIKSVNEICTSNSNNPNVLYTWVRQNVQNQMNYQQPVNNFNQYQQRQPKTCSVCNGTGYSNSKVDAPNYGTSVTKEWCKVCKSYRSPHTHMPCTICGGLGEK